MKAIKAVLDFYISSSIHVALAVCSLSWITLLKFNLPYDENLLYFVFFASIIGYNFVKYFGVVNFHYRSLTTWLIGVYELSFICLLLMGHYLFQLNVDTIIAVAVCCVITFFYAVPMLPKHFFLDDSQKLRSISGLKIYIIALVWVGVTVYLPLLNAEFYFDENVQLIAIQRFVFILALMLPFEIRDLKYDSLKLATIPQKIGVRRTKNIGLILLLVFTVLELFQPLSTSGSILRVILVAVISAVLILYSKIQQSKYYSGLLVEAVPIVWLLLILVF